MKKVIMIFCILCLCLISTMKISYANQVQVADIGAYRFVEEFNNRGNMSNDPLEITNLKKTDISKYMTNNKYVKNYDTYMGVIPEGAILFLCNKAGYIHRIIIMTNKNQYGDRVNAHATVLTSMVIIGNKNAFKELVHNHKVWINNRWICWGLSTANNQLVSNFMAFDE